MDTGEGGGFGGIYNYSSGDGHGHSLRGCHGTAHKDKHQVQQAVGCEYGSRGNGWGNGWNGTSQGDGLGAELDVDMHFHLLRSDPAPDDLRQLITNVVAFKHIFK